MNKTIAIFIFLILFVNLKADSMYPFNPDTQEVYTDTLRLRLTDVQQTEVESVGRITFTEEQLVWLRLIYPKIPNNLSVIASTHNDGGEVDDRVRVDCIWSAPNEVSITLKEKVDGKDFLFDSHGREDSADIRISTLGVMYHKGKEITLEKAYEIVRSVKNREKSSDDEPTFIRITRAPPFHAHSEYAEINNKKTADLFTALQIYGESIKVEVYPSW